MSVSGEEAMTIEDAANEARMRGLIPSCPPWGPLEPARPSNLPAASSMHIHPPESRSRTTLPTHYRPTGRRRHDRSQHRRHGRNDQVLIAGKEQRASIQADRTRDRAADGARARSRGRFQDKCPAMTSVTATEFAKSFGR
jgi:hypothetical protein